MAADNVEEDLVDGSISIIESLNLVWQATHPVDVVKSKLTKYENPPEDLPQITVAPSTKPGYSVFWCTAVPPVPPLKMRYYYLEVGMIAISNKDPITGLSDIFSWRQKITRALMGDPQQVGTSQSNTQVYDVIEHPDPVIDRKAWMNNYDVSVLLLCFRVLEPAK